MVSLKIAFFFVSSSCSISDIIWTPILRLIQIINNSGIEHSSIIKSSWFGWRSLRCREFLLISHASRGFDIAGGARFDDADLSRTLSCYVAVAGGRCTRTSESRDPERWRGIAEEFLRGFSIRNENWGRALLRAYSSIRYISVSNQHFSFLFFFFCVSRDFLRRNK